MDRSQSDLIPTGVYARSEPCRWCRGTGRTPADLDGWHVEYRYQDGRELCGPYTLAEAVALVASHSDPSSAAKLVGPDGQIYAAGGRGG